MARVDVVVVNYNGKDLVIGCLKALEQQSFKAFHVFILDNGSRDGSLVEIEKYLKGTLMASRVRLIPLGRNAGFAGSNLEALRHATGEYLALLNNDTEPDARWLAELVREMDRDPEVGICASKLLVHGADVIDSAGDGFSSSLKGFKRGEGERGISRDRREYVFGACAGAALYRRKMIEKIGFLDEDFFLIHEDTDLNFRAQLCGWKVLYVPTAIVHHKVRSSIGATSDTAIYYTLRNSEFVRIKNIPLGVLLRCFPEFVIGAVTEFLFFGLKHKRVGLYLKAKRDALRMLPRMLNKRTKIMKSRRVSQGYLLGMMTSVWEKEFAIPKLKKFFYA